MDAAIDRALFAPRYSPARRLRYDGLAEGRGYFVPEEDVMLWIIIIILLLVLLLGGGGYYGRGRWY